MQYAGENAANLPLVGVL